MYVSINRDGGSSTHQQINQHSAAHQTFDENKRKQIYYTKKSLEKSLKYTKQIVKKHMNF